MAEISLATREQSSGIDQINVAIGQMDQVTQQNAALVEEAAAAAASLEEQAGGLAGVVSAFRLEPAASVAPRTAAQRAAAQQLAPAAPQRVAARMPSLARAQPAARVSVKAPAMASDDWEEF